MSDKYYDKESKLQDAIIKKLKYLQKDGAPIWYYKAADRNTSGIPDLILCVNGKFLAIELKKNPSCKATALQEYEIARIQKANGVAVVCRTVDEAMAVIVETSEN